MIILDLKDQVISKIIIAFVMLMNYNNRSNEDIIMQVCEPYTLQQSKPTDDVVYDNQEPTVVYESIQN